MTLYTLIVHLHVNSLVSISVELLSATQLVYKKAFWFLFDALVGTEETTGYELVYGKYWLASFYTHNQKCCTNYVETSHQETVKKQTTAVSHLCKNVSEVFLMSPLRHHAAKLLDKVAACRFIPECCIVCIVQEQIIKHG